MAGDGMTTTYLPSGTVGPLAGAEYRVALAYYPESPTPYGSRWNVAEWDDTSPPALWLGPPPTDDVSCDVVSVRLVEGRDVPLSRFRPSAATVVLNDPDGLYTPWRTADDPQAFGAIHVGIDITVWAVIGATSYPRFAGTVVAIADTFPDEGGQHRVEIQAVDYLALLAAYDGVEVPPQGAGEMAGARLARIATNAGYTGARVFDVGTVALQATNLARNALDESGIAVDTEMGAYWCDRSGVLQFRDRNGLSTNPDYTTVQAVFGDADQPDAAAVVPGTAHAPTLVTSTNTTWLSQTPALAGDGNTSTYWQPVQATVTGLLVIDTHATVAQPVAGIRCRWFADGYQPNAYSVEQWTGTAWATVVSITGNTSTDRTDLFPAVATTRQLRLVITGFGAGGGGAAALAVREIEWIDAVVTAPTNEICYTDVALASNTDEVRNVVSISNTGGTAVTLNDYPSVVLYHPRTFQRMDLIHVDAAESVTIAQRNLDFFAYAANRVETITVDLATLSDADRATVLALDTLHMVEVRRRATGFQVVAKLQLQGMAESIDASSWTVTFRTFSADAVFDVARFDLADWDEGLWGY